MDAQTCLQKMKLAGTFSLATVDEAGAPQIRCVSAVHYEPDAVYFLTARGKEMARQLERDGRIQTLVHTRFNEMIRMSGVATVVPEQEQGRWIDVIYAEQPYLANVYPGATRKINVIYKVGHITIDYFNLGVRPSSARSSRLTARLRLPGATRLTPSVALAAAPARPAARRAASWRGTRIALRPSTAFTAVPAPRRARPAPSSGSRRKGEKR